jgi:voltage-gated potassium channel
VAAPLPRRRRVAIRVFDRLTIARAILIIVVVTTALVFLLAWLERLVEPETFPNYGEAMWFAISTISTTGYGDIVPETLAGRLVASVMMLISLALVPVLTSVVVSALVIRTQQRRDEKLGLTAENPD